MQKDEGFHRIIGLRWSGSWPSAVISRAQKWLLAQASIPTRQGSSFDRKLSTVPRRSFFCKTISPRSSTPWSWKTDFAKSIPSVLICMWMAPSLCWLRTAPVWHIVMPPDGAVHTIRLMRTSLCLVKDTLISWRKVAATRPAQRFYFPWNFITHKKHRKRGAQSTGHSERPSRVGRRAFRTQSHIQTATKRTLISLVFYHSRKWNVHLWLGIKIQSNYSDSWLIWPCVFCCNERSSWKGW